MFHLIFISDNLQRIGDFFLKIFLVQNVLSSSMNFRDSQNYKDEKKCEKRRLKILKFSTHRKVKNLNSLILHKLKSQIKSKCLFLKARKKAIKCKLWL